MASGGSRNLWWGVWRVREHEPIWGFGGHAPSGVQGQSPWWGVRGASPPWSWRHFHNWEENSDNKNCIIFSTVYAFNNDKMCCRKTVKLAELTTALVGTSSVIQGSNSGVGSNSSSHGDKGGSRISGGGGATQLRNSLPLGRSVAKRPRTAEGRAGGGYGRGSPPPAMGVRGYYPREIFLILLCCRWVLMPFKYTILQKSSSFVQINCSVFQQYRTNKTRPDPGFGEGFKPHTSFTCWAFVQCFTTHHINHNH